MNKETSTTLFWVHLITGVTAAIAFFLYPLYQNRKAKLAELEMRKTALIQKEQKHKDISDKVSALQDDPLAVERIAREKFKKGNPDETVIIYEK